MLFFFVIVYFATIINGQPVPKWPPQMFYNMSETYPPTVSNATVPGWFANNLQYNGGVQAIYRSDGFWDEDCAGVIGQDYHGPCTHLTIGTDRFIIHPSLNACCHCCTGCGSLIEDWVNSNTAYVGQSNISGRLCDHWTIQGFAVNNVYQTNDTKQDLCYWDNGSHDFFLVIASTYKVGPPDPSLFTLPDGCDKKACPSVADCGDFSLPTPSDRARAENWFPRPSYKGDTLSEASTVLNTHLRNTPRLLTRPCEQYTLKQLDAIQTQLFNKRAPDLINIYDHARDPRRPRLSSLEEHQELWAKMRQTVTSQPELHNMLRDGRCRETVMWYTHHLTETGKEQIRGKLMLPLLPTQLHHQPDDSASEATHWAYSQYSSMVTCNQCHL